jgi:hypothetical protein
MTQTYLTLSAVLSWPDDATGQLLAIRAAARCSVEDALNLHGYDPQKASPELGVTPEELVRLVELLPEASRERIYDGLCRVMVNVAGRAVA